MLRMLGACLVIAGAIFFGISYREEQREKLKHIRYLQKILEMFQSEIRYAKTSLPEVCFQVGRKTEEPFKTALIQICEIMRENYGQSFALVWRTQMEQCLKGLSLPQKEKDLFLDFAKCSGFADNQMQVRAIEQYASLLGQSVKQLEAVIENKEKVVMSISVTGGILLTIVLL